MAAPKGNQYWKLRAKDGRDKIFSDASVLMEEAHKYFEWCDKNPWKGVELVKYQGDFSKANVPLGRPYTIDGFASYIGVSAGYFRAAKANLQKKISDGRADDKECELLEAIEFIETVIRTQMIEGAAVGIFNACIIARLNGLVEKRDISVEDQTAMNITVRDNETSENLNRLKEML